LLQNVERAQLVAKRRARFLRRIDYQSCQLSVAFAVVSTIFQVLVVLLDGLFDVSLVFSLLSLLAQENRVAVELISVQEMHADDGYQRDSDKPCGQLDI